MSSSSDPSQDTSDLSFSTLGLTEPVLQAVLDLGYETPTPIQARIIPFVLKGQDVLGQAQTGTGKTAAFALPLLSRIDPKKTGVQALVLTPTRELAIQVAEAIHSYARHIKGFHVLPIYGGQNYTVQLKQLKRGVQVVVGTPGRVIDHIKRGTLNLDHLQTLVLDEADEMLRMGFVDDVEWVLKKTPETRQVALFSATMPRDIRRIAQRHLKNAEEVCIKLRTTTAETIHQRYWIVSGMRKLDALTRILEAEDSVDGTIVFVRTRNATTELVEKLDARGYACCALNGEMPQNQREQAIEHLKSGRLDVLVATDVAARGLDVERISHVINFDVPHDTESYVHRIGRTGRAGRSGNAILFITPRERRMLSAIERATRQKIEPLVLPSTDQINDKRIASFKQKISDTIANADTSFYLQLLEQYQQENEASTLEIAAALAHQGQGKEPLLLSEPKVRPRREERSPQGRHERSSSRRPGGGGGGGLRQEEGMERYRLAVGRSHGVRPEHIVGAIANKANLNSRNIGRIDIRDDYSTVDLPEGMPSHVLHTLKNLRVAGRPLLISKHQGGRFAHKNKRHDHS
ncbi:MAG: DEAD/DEAH box helicase [Mariprofundaceae bacterium]|nr:DEAD/DEAH box helicase [Mariprofundaceae bacterium]